MRSGILISDVEFDVFLKEQCFSNFNIMFVGENVNDFQLQMNQIIMKGLYDENVGDIYFNVEVGVVGENGGVGNCEISDKENIENNGFFIGEKGVILIERELFVCQFDIRDELLVFSIKI